MKNIFPSVVVILGVAYSVTVNAASTDFGPLLVRTQAPLQSNGVTTRLRDASAHGGGEVFVSASMASIWAETESYMLDYYQSDLTGGVQYSINPFLKVELSYLYRWAANSRLDSLSMDFHDLVGIGQNGRDEVDKHRFYINDGTNEMTDFKGEVMNEAWELYVEQVLMDNNTNAFSVGVAFYYNDVDDEPFKDRSFEQAAQLNYTGRIGSAHSFYSMLSVTHRNPEDFQNIALEEWTFNWGFSYQYRWSKPHSFLIEYRIQEGEMEESTGLAPLDQHTHEITLGYRLHLGHSALELAMVENVINMDNSADIAFTASVRHQF